MLDASWNTNVQMLSSVPEKPGSNVLAVPPPTASHVGRPVPIAKIPAEVSESAQQYEIVSDNYRGTVEE